MLKLFLFRLKSIHIRGVLVLGLATASILATHLAWADCSGSGLAPNDPLGQGCVYVSPSQPVSNMPPSLTAPDGSTYTHYACTIDNSKCGEQIMAPFYTAAEWESFYSNTTCATFTNCKINPCNNLGAGQVFTIDASKSCGVVINGHSIALTCMGSYSAYSCDSWGNCSGSGLPYPQSADIPEAARICQEQAQQLLTQADATLPCHPDAIYPVGYSFGTFSDCQGCVFPYWDAKNWTPGTGPTQYKATVYPQNSDDSYGRLVTVACGTQPVFCPPTTMTFNGNAYNLPYGLPTGAQGLESGTVGWCIMDTTVATQTQTDPKTLGYSNCGGLTLKGSLTDTSSSESNDGTTDVLFACASSGWQFAGAALCDSTHYNCQYGNSTNNGTIAPPAITRSVLGHTECYYLKSRAPCTSTYPVDPYDAAYCMWTSSTAGSFSCPAWDGPKYSWQCQNPANSATVSCTSSD